MKSYFEMFGNPFTPKPLIGITDTSVRYTINVHQTHEEARSEVKKDLVDKVVTEEKEEPKSEFPVPVVPHYEVSQGLFGKMKVRRTN